MGQAKRRKAEIEQLKAGSNAIVLEQLKDINNGFNLLFKFETKNRTYSIFQPTLTPEDYPGAEAYLKSIEEDESEELYVRHLRVYEKAFGGVESQSFNLYNSLERMAMNYYENMSGHAPFRAFGGGSYRLNFLVVEDKEEGITIVPMLDHSWDKESYIFKSAYGDDRKLPHILSMIARSNMAGIPLSGFNPHRDQMLKDYQQNLWVRPFTETVKKNWQSQYELCYQLYLDIIHSETKSGFSDKELSDLHHIFD